MTDESMQSPSTDDDSTEGRNTKTITNKLKSDKAILNETYTKNFLPSATAATTTQSVLKKSKSDSRIANHSAGRTRRRSVHFKENTDADLTPYHVVVSCSVDKQFEIRSLTKTLTEAGYQVKMVLLRDKCRLDHLLTEVIISALSLRYCQSNQAGNELDKASKAGVAVIPLLLDNMRYPPPILSDAAMRRLQPIDCTEMKSRTEWTGSRQLEQLLDRLETLVPTVTPIRGPKREATLSHIPQPKKHTHRQDKQIPKDPLAREASEIRIQIRPPTPLNKDGSHIPLPANGLVRRSSLHADDAYQAEDDEQGPELTDSEKEEETINVGDDGGNEMNEDLAGSAANDYDSEGEKKMAKSMQNEYKLPMIKRNQSPTVGTPSKTPPTRQQPIVRSTPATVNSNNVGSTGSNADALKRSRQHRPIIDFDGPKLPSVYRRKRFSIDGGFG